MPGARAPTSPTASDHDVPIRQPKRVPKEREKAKHSPAPSPEKPRRTGDRDRRKSSSPVKATARDRTKYHSGASASSTSGLLSADALSKLNAHNERIEVEEKYQARKQKEKQYKNIKATEAQQKRRRRKSRNVSGAILEEGRGGERHRKSRPRGGDYEKEYVHKRTSKGTSKRKWWIIGAVLLALVAIIVAVAIAVSNKKKTSAAGGSVVAADDNSNLANNCDSSSVPENVKGTYLDISTWLDTTDFNCTYTAETIGGLSVMGLKSDWDDSRRANDNVPPLNEKWTYGQRPIRGVNVGGWLSIEPFITPSLFNYPASANVVDEWTLTEKLGSSAQRTIETHYATFITKQSFQDIASAGLDHVRIPFPYWAVTTYPGDPYVPKVAWRYLLRAIEWARESGIRVNLDLHAVPGSQNGWAHSGHQGDIGWILGSDGATNAQRSLDIHNQLSQFFAQDRYKNVVTIYGLVNEPKMLVIPVQSVLDWNQKAISIVRANGLQQYIVFGDGFLSLDSWDDLFHGVDSKLVMDTHQYQIFNVGQLKLKHQDKINLACSGWTGLMVAANNAQTG